MAHKTSVTDGLRDGDLVVTTSSVTLRGPGLNKRITRQERGVVYERQVFVEGNPKHKVPHLARLGLPFSLIESVKVVGHVDPVFEGDDVWFDVGWNPQYPRLAGSGWPRRKMKWVQSPS